MRLPTACFLVFISVSVFSQGKKDFNFKNLLALEGTWSMPSGNGVIIEDWVRQSKNELKGSSYKIENGDTTFMENLRLVRSKNLIQYIPTVFNQNEGQPVIFTLVAVDDGQYVFENTEHDFPQRIIYHLKEKNSLVARINGKTSKGFRENIFEYVRIK